MFCIKQIIQQKRKTGRSHHLLFIDLTKVYDNVQLIELWRALQLTNINDTLIKTLKEQHN